MGSGGAARPLSGSRQGWAAGGGPAALPPAPPHPPRRAGSTTEQTGLLYCKTFTNPQTCYKTANPGFFLWGENRAHHIHSLTRTKHGRRERKEKKGGGGQRGGRLEIGKCAPGQERAFSGLASPPSSALPASLGCQRGIFHLGGSPSDAFGTFAAVAVPLTAVNYHYPLGWGSPWEGAPPGGPEGRDFYWKRAHAPCECPRRWAALRPSRPSRASSTRQR